ncbi:dihydropteroate synthase [Magnetococcus sp. PR-3]|uniref:dihydropteroate synthase n=1 Tax=Magnetococcus sp. PR-3 TaxID=3120355 RepID=UPI002FCE43AF
MTHYAVITPTMGALGAHFFSAQKQGEEVPPFPPLPQLPMAVRLFPWREDWDPLLAPGMESFESGRLRMARGWLKKADIEAWQNRLFQTIAQEASLALHHSLSNLEAPPSPVRFRNLAGQLQSLPQQRPLVMGIVNVTPDSFSDGGRHADTASAVHHALALVEAGADILDVGGESTRPGADAVAVEEELRRVIPVVRAIRAQTEIPISVDTTKGQVMAAALEAGAVIINDVTALQSDPIAPRIMRDAHCPIILMHMQGTPRTMQKNPHYEDVVAEVYSYLSDRMLWCVENGIARDRLVIDPGIGFGKSHAHNMELMAHLGAFKGTGATTLLGISRKRIIGHLTGVDEANQRDIGSHMMATLGVQRGANWVRVHDVAGVKQALSCLC